MERRDRTGARCVPSARFVQILELGSKLIHFLAVPGHPLHQIVQIDALTFGFSSRRPKSLYFAGLSFRTGHLAVKE